MEKIVEGVFEVIDSFVIRQRGEFYLIGNLKEGKVNKDWFLNIPFTKSLALTVRIAAIEDLEMTNDSTIYKLLIVNGDTEFLNFLLANNIANEYLDITITGKD